MGNYVYNKLEVYIDEEYLSKEDNFYDLINFITKEEIEGLSELNFSFFKINPRLKEFIRSQEPQEEYLKTSNNEETKSISIDKEDLYSFSSEEELKAIMMPTCYIYKHWNQEINNKFKLEVYFISYRFEISHIISDLSKIYSYYTFKYSFLDQGYLFGAETIFKEGEISNNIDLKDMSEEYILELEHTLNTNSMMLNYIDFILFEYEIMKDNTLSRSYKNLLQEYKNFLQGKEYNDTNFETSIQEDNINNNDYNEYNSIDELYELNNKKIFIKNKLIGEIKYYKNTKIWKYILNENQSKDYTNQDTAIRDLKKQVYREYKSFITLI